MLKALNSEAKVNVEIEGGFESFTQIWCFWALRPLKHRRALPIMPPSPFRHTLTKAMALDSSIALKVGFHFSLISLAVSATKPRDTSSYHDVEILPTAKILKLLQVKANGATLHSEEAREVILGNLNVQTLTMGSVFWPFQAPSTLDLANDLSFIISDLDMEMLTLTSDLNLALSSHSFPTATSSHLSMILSH